MISLEREKGGTVIRDGEAIAFLRAAEGAEDSFDVNQKTGMITWTRRFSEDRCKTLMEAETSYSSDFGMIPAVSYNGNLWGNDHDYKGWSRGKEPWVFAWHRCAVCGATFSVSRDQRESLALFAEEPCSCSLYQKENGTMVHRLLWPVQEGPAVLYGDGEWGPSYAETMEGKREFSARIVVGREESPAYREMLSCVWRQNFPAFASRHKKTQISRQEVWRRSIYFARSLYTQEPDGFCGYSIGYEWRDGAWRKREKIRYESGWCGQNISLAVSLLYEATAGGDTELKKQAASVLNSWTQMAVNRKGESLTRYDDPKDPMDACNLGTEAVQLLEAADFAGKHFPDLKEDADRWREAALSICDFTLRQMDGEGRIPDRWDRNGNVTAEGGMGGAFLIPALTEAWKRSSGPEYRDGALRSFAFFYELFRSRGYGMGGALDSACIDKESVIPLLRGALDLYRITGEKKYLSCAENAAWYLSTWQWHYSMSFPEGTALSKIGYDTFGGTAVSTSHMHQDFFALSYVPSLLELSGITGNPEWRERAEAIWINGTQNISDGTAVIPPTGPRPEGGSDEGYIHTRWGKYQNENSAWGEPFGVTQWLVAWPCAFRLECLRKGADFDGKKDLEDAGSSV